MIEDAQTQLDAWVVEYNEERPHQGIGNVAPIERCRLRAEPSAAKATKVSAVDPAGSMAPAATRRVTRGGKVPFASTSYAVGVCCLVQVQHPPAELRRVSPWHDDLPVVSARSQLSQPRYRRGRPSTLEHHHPTGLQTRRTNDNRPVTGRWPRRRVPPRATRCRVL